MYRHPFMCNRFLSRLSSVLYKSSLVCSPAYTLRINCYHTNIKKRIFYPCENLRLNTRTRSFHKGKENNKDDRTIHRTTAYYGCAVLVLTLGCTYAAVPLYRIFCQTFGYGGTVAEGGSSVDASKFEKRRHREIRVRFNADVNASLNWNFHPQQTEIVVTPGETALAFYTAENPLDKPVIGVSTYNVVPFDVGQYFNKIQCFCFEEQMLNPHEQVDMPVFFYIDPDFAEDPKMENVNDIILSYTFFEVKEGLNLPIPSYYSPHKK